MKNTVNNVYLTDLYTPLTLHDDLTATTSLNTPLVNAHSLTATDISTSTLNGLSIDQYDAKDQQAVVSTGKSYEINVFSSFIQIPSFLLIANSLHFQTLYSKRVNESILMNSLVCGSQLGISLPELLAAYPQFGALPSYITALVDPRVSVGKPHPDGRSLRW